MPSSSSLASPPAPCGSPSSSPHAHDQRELTVCSCLSSSVHRLRCCLAPLADPSPIASPSDQRPPRIVPFDPPLPPLSHCRTVLPNLLSPPQQTQAALTVHRLPNASRSSPGQPTSVVRCPDRVAEAQGKGSCWRSASRRQRRAISLGSQYRLTHQYLLEAEKGRTLLVPDWPSTGHHDQGPEPDPSTPHRSG